MGTYSDFPKQKLFQPYADGRKGCMIAEISPVASSLRSEPKQSKQEKTRGKLCKCQRMAIPDIESQGARSTQGGNAKRLDNLSPTHLSTQSQHTLHLFLVLCFIAKFHKFLLHMSTSITPISLHPIYQLVMQGVPKNQQKKLIEKNPNPNQIHLA